MASKLPGATNAKTAALGIMAVVAAVAIDNSGSLKAAAQGASSLPMIGSVMAPLVMIAILLEMEKLNQSLRVFLFKINHVLKQMLNTVKLITEVSMDFKIVLNQPALEGITSELAELTEILALYYKVYADAAKPESSTATSDLVTAPPSSTLSRFTSSVKSAASKVGSVASKVGSYAIRMANKMNTFASVEANKSKALDNIVIANMYFNMLFSQMEFQLKMVSQNNDEEMKAYKDKLNTLKDSEAYKAISSYGTVPAAVDARLDNLINNIKNDPKVVNAADKAGTAAEVEAESEESKKKLQEEPDTGKVDEIRGGAIKRRHVITETNIDPMKEPFIVDRIVHFFQTQLYPAPCKRKQYIRTDRSRRHRNRRRRSRSTAMRRK